MRRRGPWLPPPLLQVFLLLLVSPPVLLASSSAGETLVDRDLISSDECVCVCCVRAFHASRRARGWRRTVRCAVVCGLDGVCRRSPDPTTFGNAIVPTLQRTQRGAAAAAAATRQAVATVSTRRRRTGVVAPAGASTHGRLRTTPRLEARVVAAADDALSRRRRAPSSATARSGTCRLLPPATQRACGGGLKKVGDVTISPRARTRGLVRGI